MKRTVATANLYIVIIKLFINNSLQLCPKKLQSVTKIMGKTAI